MEYVKLVLVILHVSAVAMLFGAPLGLARMARAALSRNDEAFKLAAEEAARRTKLTVMSSIGTLLTGIALIFFIGGFAAAPKNFHAALGVLLLAMLFSFLWMRPNTVKLVQSSLKNPIDRSGADAALKKLGMGGGILHLAWLINLTLMFYRF
jgi:hypothetical protein